MCALSLLDNRVYDIAMISTCENHCDDFDQQGMHYANVNKNVYMCEHTH